jgi:hypothetical protein
VLPLFYPGNLNIADVGLAVPDLEKWYLDANGDLLSGNQQGTDVVLDQQTMPAITTFTTSSTAQPPNQPTAIASSPYQANQPQPVKLYIDNWPIFANFPFGYVADNLDWFTAEGIPMSTYDDSGRLNSYPLMRVQAKAAQGNSLGLAAGTVLATVDTVLPISAEADCKGCHADPVDPNYAPTNMTVANNIAGILGGGYLASSDHDPKYNTVPTAVSIEWAADKNILRLHDYNEGSKYPAACNLETNPSNPNANCLVNKTPVVCQTCHYTPALDLIQLGPTNSVLPGLSAEANNQSMSRVIHNFHGLRNAAGTAVSTSSSDLLFPYMPPANQTRDTQAILTQTCYQCHPGKVTKCLRGAMANAGVVCQDCHGQMTQVGDDFSKNMPGGSFILANNFYTNASTPRVPWVNEPGCGSCHTGDATSNLALTSGVIVNATDTYGNPDGIRLRQAYLTAADCTTQKPGSCPKVTPIVPTNKRFAEDVIDPSALPGTAPGTNPKLYRFSVGGQIANGSPSANGHNGLFCEACHGATHAEWPVQPTSGTYVANDNQTANQLQGHTGVIIECSTCHGSAMDGQITLGGPHGMHPVGNVSFVNGGHEGMAEGSGRQKCAACHGAQGQGTVLSVAKVDRQVSGHTITKGTQVSCNLCHGNPFTGGGD